MIASRAAILAVASIALSQLAHAQAPTQSRIAQLQKTYILCVTMLSSDGRRCFVTRGDQPCGGGYGRVGAFYDTHADVCAEATGRYRDYCLDSLKGC